MNKAILHKDVQDFISENLNHDITKLILKGSPFKTITIQELAEQIVAKKKCKNKLPTWFNNQNIYYPNKLNIEQTSSETTANYKANLINGKSIIDLTGGFGVDCLAFSKHFTDVTHCEINKPLSKIVNLNYKQLNIKNISIIADDGLQYLSKCSTVYDWIYIDPSRRDDLKKRVFLLMDCLPNIPKNLDLLFQFSNNILIKTAPLLDINAAINEMKFVKEIHIIALNNDVKEVLYILEKGFTKTIGYKTINFTKDKNHFFDFTFSNINANYALPKKYLYEPNAAILKSGAFNNIAIQLNIDKLHKHSHLYTSTVLVDFPGRCFIINAIHPYSAKKIAKLVSNKKANVTTRNFPESVAQIRKKTNLKDGGNLYLFFTTNCNNEKIVIFCEKF